METRLRLLLLDPSLPHPTTQHTIYNDRGRRLARVDLAYPALCIAIEYDGDHQRQAGQFRRDVTRLNDLRAAGWLVLRFTADDVLRNQEGVIAHVAQAVQERKSRAKV